jgi:hypothetical protein
LPALIIAFLAWKVGSALLVRRRLPQLIHEGAHSTLARQRLRRLGFQRVARCGVVADSALRPALRPA